MAHLDVDHDDDDDEGNGGGGGQNRRYATKERIFTFVATAAAFFSEPESGLDFFCLLDFLF